MPAKNRSSIMPKPILVFVALHALLLSATLEAQCREENMSCSGITTQTASNITAIYCGKSPGATITGLTIRSRRQAGSGIGRIELWLADTSGKPTQLVASGQITIEGYFGSHRGCFGTPYYMPAGQDYAVTFTSSRAAMPRCNSGTATTYYWRRPSEQGWRGPFSSTWAFKVECAPCQPTLNGSYVTMGMGCPGSAAAPACHSANMQCSSPLGQAAGSSSYAIMCPIVTAREITGATLRTKSLSGTSIGRIEIWQADNSGMPISLLASTHISVGPTYGNYTGTFARSIGLPGNARIALAFYLPGCELPACSSGAQQQAFAYRMGTSGSWTPPGVGGYYWNYQLECSRVEPYTPLLYGGIPRLEETFVLSLNRALPGSNALALLGISQHIWFGNPLPFNLGPLGAPLCGLQCAFVQAIPATVDAQGKAQMQMTLPPTRSLAGQVFCNQWLVLDPAANAMGIAVSGRGEGTIGG